MIGGEGVETSRTVEAEHPYCALADERMLDNTDIEDLRRGQAEAGTVASVKAVTVPKAPFVPPMLATLVKPTDHYRASGPGDWQYERKLDGLRGLAVRNAGRVELFSRNRLSFNAHFPDVVAALADLPFKSFVLDGELVAFDGGQASFSLLQSAPHPEYLTYCVFDRLHLNRRDTTLLPLTERQALLADTLESGGRPLSLVKPLQGEAADLLERACESGWEGLVAKRVESPYRSGRSPDWQKLKCTASQELVIGGWTEPTRSRVGLGALLVGYYDDQKRLRFAGKVGTGFTNELLRRLYQDLISRGVARLPVL
jgi:bifunctional non-homologous end joining protein LigD